MDAKQAIKLAEDFVKTREEVLLDPETGCALEDVDFRITNSKFVGQVLTTDYIVEVSYEHVSKKENWGDAAMYQVFIPADATEGNDWFDHNIL